MSLIFASQVVTTEDVDPTNAPFKISAVAGKTALRFQVNISGAAGKSVKALMLRWRSGGVRSAGTQIRGMGVCCGTGQRCGALGAMPLSVPVDVTPYSVDWTVNYADLPSTGDGDYDLQLYAGNTTDGWS